MYVCINNKDYIYFTDKNIKMIVYEMPDLHRVGKKAWEYNW